MTSDGPLSDVFAVHIDDSNLAADSARIRAAAISMGFAEYCLQIGEFGLKKQQAWKHVRMYFTDKSFAEFSAEFDRDAHCSDPSAG